MIAGQAVSGARFGMAWAEGVVAQKMYTPSDGAPRLAFNEVTLSEMVYDQTIATMAIAIVVGLVIGAAVQRHLINGVGCFSATLFFAWLALVVIFALPLLIYANLRSIFNQDKANEDCAAFPDTGYDFSRGACEARWWNFLTGGILLFGTILVMTGFGLIEASTSILKVRNKVAVRLRRLRGYHPAMRDGPSMLASDAHVAYSQGQIEKHHLLGGGAGFRSPDESFFNFKTNAHADGSNELLYAPRIQLAAASLVPLAHGVPVVNPTATGRGA